MTRGSKTHLLLCLKIPHTPLALQTLHPTDSRALENREKRSKRGCFALPYLQNLPGPGGKCRAEVAARRVAARGRAAPGPGDSRRRLLCGPGPQRRLSLPSGPAASCPGNASSGSCGELRAALSPSFQCSEAMRFFIIFCSPLPKHT